MMPEMEQMQAGSCDDVLLVRYAKLGNVEAFEELIRRHTDMIRRVAWQITNSREDAEDVAQEAFLKAYQNLQHFEERSRFSTWLTRIAINEALIQLRRPRRTSMISIDDEEGEFRSLEFQFTDGRPDPEQICCRAQINETLQKTLDSLPHAYRVVFLMRDVEGLSTLDTAEVLEMSVPSVKARLLRARHKLREGLKPHFKRARAATACSSAPDQILDESRAA